MVGMVTPSNVLKSLSAIYISNPHESSAMRAKFVDASGI